MKPSFSLFFLLLFFQTTYAQTTSPDSAQTERLFKLCQLWGHLHFFHPSLAYRDIPFDSAFAAVVPEVIAAKDSSQYAGAIQKMLAVLEDPATRILENSNQAPGHFSEGERHPIHHFTADSILVVSLHNYQDLSDWNATIPKFSNIASLFPKAKGVVFDLRSAQPANSFMWYFDYALNQSGLKSQFSASPLMTPGSRSRIYDGFAPERGGSSGGYSSGFQIRDGEYIVPAPGAKSLPSVFLINRHSLLPSFALALQETGKGAILAEGHTSDAMLAGTVPFDMGEGIWINMRFSEPMTRNGAVGLPINKKLKETNLDVSSVQAAIDFLKTGKFALPPSASAPPIVAAPKPGKYPPGTYPDLGYRILAAAKTWAVIKYFFAYKELMEKDWDQVLREYLPKFAAAGDSLQYVLTLAEMYTHIEDGHGFINSPVLRSYYGTAYPPVVVRMIENQLVITAFAVDSVALSLGLEIGEIVTHIEGEPTKNRLDRLEKTIAAANANWRRYSAARWALTGAAEIPVKVTIQGKNGKERTLELPRSWSWWRVQQERANERHQTEVIRILPGNTGYVDLERLRQDQVDGMFDQLKSTRAIIFDMRGYPQGTAWSIAPRLAQQDRVSAAYFQRYMALGPDIAFGDAGQQFSKNSFYQQIPFSDQEKYKGKTVMLIDERTISQAEHTGLFFEAANGTKFIGSQTAGSNGDVTSFLVPGQISLFFSGHDVRHADGRQLQKTGLVPHLEVRPTIEGIRAGRDEVLEKALEFLKN